MALPDRNLDIPWGPTETAQDRHPSSTEEATIQSDGEINLADLKGASLAELEALYLARPVLPLPAGLLTGRLLGWLDAPEARHPLWRPLLTGMFELAPFGVDFDRRRWFFGHRRLQVGRFEASPGPSVWHPTETYRLGYEGSRLPGPIRGLLYDELKPLSDRLCLGIGGLNPSGRPAAVFFFGLEREGR